MVSRQSSRTSAPTLDWIQNLHTSAVIIDICACVFLARHIFVCYWHCRLLSELVCAASRRPGYETSYMYITHVIVHRRITCKQFTAANVCVCGSSYSVLFSVWHIESSYLIPCVSTGLCVFVCVWGIPFTNLTLVQLDFRHARQCLPGKFGATQSTQNIPQVFTITNLIDLKDTLESLPHKLGHVNCKSFAYASA